MKRLHILTILAALTLLLCCLLPTKAEAATSGYYTYTVSGGKATITDCDTSISGNITIPSTLGGYPVTSIGSSAFLSCSSLTSITIPDSVTSIGNYAFFYCSSLISITIPNSVTSIGSSAFSGCSSLTSITIPDGVTSIGRYAFSSCDSLTSITIPDSVTSIGDSAFSGCDSLTSITIPDGVTSIGSSAFEGCSSLTGITIPDGVTSIGYSAFRDCSSLTSITIPDSVTSIGNYAFYNCSSLTSITIPDSVTSIGERAFYDCSSLTSITIPDSVTSIGYSAFRGCSSLTGITIPDSVTSIGDYAFYNCGSLDHVAYTGTQAQWAAVTVGMMNEALRGVANFHYETTFENIDTCAQTGIYCPACQALISGTTWTSSNPNPKVPHQIVAATCTTPKTCTICFVTEGEALGHKAVVDAAAVAPTCTKSGLTEGSHCVICNVVIKTQESVPATGHSGQWFELIPVACVADGINARICTICGETEVETVTAPGHNYSAVVTAPTCTEKGYTTKTCAACGDVTVTDYVDATGHDYSEVVVQPTCTTQGYTAKTCVACEDMVIIDYVAAKGHGWSAWIQISAASCKAEGSKMRFCTCGTRETEAIAKLPHSYENDVCTVCGDVAQYDWVLTENTAVNRTLTQDLYIDLNGYDLSGTIITNGFKVYGKDSSTDGYTCDSMGSFTCVDEKGNFIVPERICAEGEKQYMAICEEDRYSFHRFFVGITHMSLEPEVVGLGYKSAIYGDEMVFAELAATKAFTFRVQLEGYNPVYRRFDRNELTSGNPITLRIRNYDVENYSEHNLYAQVSLTLNDGTVIETEQVSLTFRWLAEQVSANYTDYTTEQIASFKAMLQAFDVVKKWNIPNLI